MPEMYLFIISFLLILTPIKSSDHFCGVNEEPPIVDIEPNSTNTLESDPIPNADVPYTPYRIYYDYTHLNSQLSAYGQEYINGIKNALEQAKMLFEKVITFQKRSELLALGSRSCMSLQISPTVKSPGVPADIIIFPYIDSTITGNTIAAAMACILGSYPKAGYIKISTKLNFTPKYSMEYYRGVFMHEMTHIFVFHKSMFYLFTDQTGQVYKDSITFEKEVNGVKKLYLRTPKVIEAAKKHFSCNSLDGLPLEDQGEDGTVGHHWDARAMLGDYMIGETYPESFISDITMALFEDSGWYKMNYYTGGLFKFGKGEGCGFLNTKCIVNKQSTYPKYFGIKAKDPMCLQGRTTKGICSFSRYSSIPPAFQYFDDPTQGGHQLADYCPIPQTYAGNDNRYPYSCKTAEFSSGIYGEVISSSSNCFISTLVLKDKPLMMNPMTLCYPFRCDFAKKTTVITVLNIDIECPTEGGDKTHEAFNGYINCPKFNEICTTKTYCFDIAECIDKKSFTYDSTKEEEGKEDGKGEEGDKGEGGNTIGSFTKLSNSFLIILIALLLG